MHTFRDFRALRVDTEVVGSIAELRAGNFGPEHLVEDEESGFYLYEMARWSESGQPLRVVGAIGVLSLGSAGASGTVGHAAWRAAAADPGGRAASEAPWAIVETDVIDQVNPYRIGPIARISDTEGVAHRIYALVQPAAIEMVRRAVEESPSALIGPVPGLPEGSDAWETLVFVCQAKDLPALVKPVHRLFHGPGAGRAFDELPARFAIRTEPPAEAHLTLHCAGRRAFMPVGESVSDAVGKVEAHFGWSGEISMERTTDAHLIEIESRFPDVVGMTCPALPVDELLASARQGRQPETLGALFHPRPLTSLVLGEATGPDEAQRA